jgi:hypothetical protein
MAKNSKGDERNGDLDRGARDDAPPSEDALARLERALAAETATSSSLRESLDALRSKVEQIEASFTQRLEEATRRSSTAEHKLADQQQRLAALGSGREETMRLLAEARSAVARVTIERDELRKQLARVDGMQSSTVALTEEEQDEEPAIQPALPSIEDLMASLGVIEEAGAAPQPRREGGHLQARVTLDDEESQEMIAPELVFPEEFEEKKGEKPTRADDAAAGASGSISRVLVFLDAKQPIKYPLYKKVMTIGRADDADIQVNSDFISRVHARLVSTEAGVTIEDVDSKNGIKVNSKPIERQTLRHGDVLGLGRLRFTFIDTAAAD